MENITFETTGLLIGMIGYPFDTEGVKFYEEEFEKNLFQAYKDNVAKGFGQNEEIEYKKLAVFEPVGYHLFGSYNLAVLSLTDGYAFGNRVFHPGHENSNDNSSNYRYQVLTGVGCKIADSKDYLSSKAKSTFLKESERYPYIGITRLKLNNSFLIGTGMNLMQRIRIQLESILYTDFAGTNLQAFTIDTFGSSEIILLSFSDSLMRLHKLITKIKSLKINDLDEKEVLVEDSLLNILCSENKGEFHVFSGSYTHLGYDLRWEKNKDIFLRYLQQEEPELKMEFRWELKPGHDKALSEVKNYYEKKWREKVSHKWSSKQSEDLKELKRKWKQRLWIYNPVKCHLTGANVNYIKLNYDLNTYRSYICSFFEKLKLGRHLRSLRTHLYYMDDTLIEGEDIHEDYEWNFEGLKIDKDEMNHFREQLVRCGISKLTKERIMKMFARFNEYIQNRQTYIYFIELRGYLLHVMKLIDNFVADENSDIEEIDSYLNYVIAAFDGAFFNRFHQSVREGAQNDITLEYNGGMQQYASTFTLIFKEAVQTLNCHFPQKREVNAFVYISGYESVISQRDIMRINMNLITFPELFAISIYKEAGNFIIEKEEKPLEKSKIDLERNFEKWHEGLFLNTLPHSLVQTIKNNPVYREDCTAHRYLANSLNVELLKYILADIHNLYFGFNGNYHLLHYFYWKYLLQLSTSYKRNGELKVKDFISFLFRLFMIQFYMHRNESRIRHTIIQEWKNKVFDPRLNSLWKTHFEGVLDMAEVMWNSLKQEGFQQFLEGEIYKKIKVIADEDYKSYVNFRMFLNKRGITGRDEINAYWFSQRNELDAGSMEPLDNRRDVNDFLKFWEDIRKLRIEKLQNDIKKHKLLCADKNEVFKEVFISDMLIAYLEVIHSLDAPDDGSGRLKSLIRDREGKAYCGIKELYDNFSPLLSDPQGGFYTHGLQQRMEYFCYRTLLFKSLWNYSIRKKKEKIMNIITSKTN